MVFDDVVGQSHVTNTLRNAIASKRVAHAYIFSGTRGCGKTTTARIFARALNCLHPVDQNPDNTCEICTEIIDGRSMDIIEIDGASNNGVEEVRNLRESVRYTPARGSYKIYIIDEVHMLSNAAFNALLKTLEEPPPHVIFILATTEVHKMPMTILSRCQRFDFRRISIEEISERLLLIAKDEQVSIEPEALAIIARRADGSMRDAQSIFDQVRSFCGNSITAADLLKAFNVVDQELYFRFTDLFRTHDANGAIELVDVLIKGGYNLREFVGGLIEHLRNLLVVRSTNSTQLIEVSEQYRQRYASEAPNVADADLLRLIKQAADLDQTLRFASQPRYRVEATLVQMVRMENAVQLNALLQQIDELKKKLHDVPAPRTEVRVTGEVSAGYLKSPAAIRYSPSASPVIENKRNGNGGANTSASILSIVTPREESSLSSDAVLSRWSEFVGSIVKDRVGTGTSLSVSRLIGTHNGSIRVLCPDEYHQSNLRRERDFLADMVHRFFGSRAVIDAVTESEQAERSSVSHGGSQTTGASAEAPPNGASSSQRSTAGEEHPIIAVLKREFGAERVGE